MDIPFVKDVPSCQLMVDLEETLMYLINVSIYFYTIVNCFIYLALEYPVKRYFAQFHKELFTEKPRIYFFPGWLVGDYGVSSEFNLSFYLEAWHLLPILLWHMITFSFSWFVSCMACTLLRNIFLISKMQNILKGAPITLFRNINTILLFINPHNTYPYSSSTETTIYKNPKKKKILS